MKQYLAGKQIKIICENCLIWEMNDRSSLALLLVKMCEVIEMSRLGGPYLEEVCYEDGNGEEDGISGLLMIMSGCLFVRAWNQSRKVRVMVDSWADFNGDVLSQLLIDTLLPNYIQEE
jgi:hypothetical protein